MSLRLTLSRLAVGLAVTAATVAVATPAFADTTPPTPPGNDAVTEVTETSVTLRWDPSTDDTGVVRYEVWLHVTDIVQRVATTTGTSIVLTGLRSGRTYSYAVRAFDAAGYSAGTPFVKVTTLPGDNTPPTAPGQPVVTSVDATSVSLRFGSSADFNGVDRYLIYRVDGETLTQVATSPGHPPSYRATIGNLTPLTTYRFVVRAEDPVGNLSPPSSTVEVTTLATGSTAVTTPPSTPPAVACAVTYRLVSQWGTGFQATVTVRNLAATALSSWTLRWTFPSGQKVVNLWNGSYEQPDASVSVRPVSWNQAIAAGGSREIGFVGSSPSGNRVPTDFAVNGVACGGS